MRSRPTLEVRDLKVSFDGEEILRGENFRLEGPRLVLVMGPNGAGKTTLFRALLGLIRVSGKVLVNGRDVTNRPEVAGRLMGYMPQWVGNDYSFPISVRELVESALVLRRPPIRLFSPKDVRGKVEELLSSLGVGDVGDRPINELSGGKRQRVLLARALVWDPPILPLDEPLSAVDPLGKAELADIISELSEERLVLITSHEPGLFKDRASMVMVMNRGVMALGPPEETLNEELLSRVYGRSVFIVERCVHVVDSHVH